jgi:uncharacterized protein (TIGR00369 family)
MSGATDQGRQLLAMVPFAETLGVEMVTATPEEVRARVAWEPSRCTAAGVLHGGVIMGLADTTGAISAFLNLPKEASGTATIESKTNFFRAVREGYVEAISRPLHVGGSTIVVESDVFDSQGRRVAKVIQTQAVLGR